MNLLNFFASNEGIKSLNSDEFYEMLSKEKDACLVDVRTPVEFKQVRIPNAILIDFHNPDFRSNIDKLDRSKKYLIYCRSGHRSLNACREFKNLGFQEVFNLSGGISAWKGKVQQG
jgi:rhodanese-related sulfurtransferase